VDHRPLTFGLPRYDLGVSGKNAGEMGNPQGISKLCFSVPRRRGWRADASDGASEEKRDLSLSSRSGMNEEKETVP
jgi:hypothetical protein